METAKPHWQSCQHPDPQVKLLCRALSTWVCGDMDEVQNDLLALEATANHFTSGHAALYRGYMPDRAQKESLRQNGFFDIISAGRPLASWSSEQDSATDFMFGFDSAYVVIKKEGLDEFCDLVRFDEEAQPFTKMRAQDEVIVKMPPVLRVNASDIVFRSE
jgi:hypothetical protein